MSKTLSDNMRQLISLLGDGAWHDGDALGAALSVSRSAVWKMIKKLEAYDVDIQSNKGRGYQLQESLVMLDEKRIKHSLIKTCDVHVFETIKSTNDYCRDMMDADSIVCVLAEKQTQGRGRFGREWHSPFAKNIYLSCRYPLDKDISELAGLSLVVALAIIKAMKPYIDKNTLQAKWPNDVLSEGKKLAGNLIEIKAESHGRCQVIIGIGANVNLQQDDGHIAQPWTSLMTLAGKYVDRNQLAASLINELLTYLEKFRQQGLPAFMQEWQQVDCLMGKPIVLQGVNKKITGTAQGVNTQGHLLVKTGSGKVEAHSAGDVSMSF